MDYQLAQSFAEFLQGLLFILGFMGIWAVLTVFMFLLLTSRYWTPKLVQCWNRGIRGWKLIKCVFG